MEALSWSLSTLTLLLWVFYVVFGLFIFHFPKVFYLLDWTASGCLLHFVHWKRKNAKDFIQDKWVIVYLMYACYTVSIVLVSFFLRYFFISFLFDIVSRRNSTVLCSYAQTLLPSRSPIGNCHCSTEFAFKSRLSEAKTQDDNRYHTAVHVDSCSCRPSGRILLGLDPF